MLIILDLESQVGDGCAPEVETAIQSGNRAINEKKAINNTLFILFSIILVQIKNEHLNIINGVFFRKFHKAWLLNP